MAAYLDEVIVISESFEEHELDLRVVFERLALFKLLLRREKCVFAKKSVKYLVHILTQQEIHVDTEKTSGDISHGPTQKCRGGDVVLPNLLVA